MTRLDDLARHALDQLSAKIERSKAEAWAHGLDFAHGPVEVSRDEIGPIERPIKHTVSVPGGPVQQGFSPPPGWTVYRCPQPGEPEQVQWTDADGGGGGGVVG